MRRALAPLRGDRSRRSPRRPRPPAPPRRSRGFFFELHADGFEVQGRSALGSGRVRLLLDRHGEVAYYNVGARIGAGTVRARFGRLGSLDLRFAPGPGEGAARLRRQGRLAARELQRLARLPRRAPLRRRRRRLARRAGSRPLPQRGARGLQLGARRRGRRPRAGPPRSPKPAPPSKACDLLPARRSDSSTPSPRTGPAGVRVAFNAFRAEHREGMLIDRGVAGATAAPTASTGTSAPGRRRSNRPRRSPAAPSTAAEPTAGSRWWGSLRAPILGGRPMRLTGAAFARPPRPRHLSPLVGRGASAPRYRDGHVACP